MDKYDEIYMSLSKQIDDIIAFSSLCMLEAVQEEEQGQDSSDKKRVAVKGTITALKIAIAKTEQELR